MGLSFSVNEHCLRDSVLMWRAPCAGEEDAISRGYNADFAVVQQGDQPFRRPLRFFGSALYNNVAAQVMCAFCAIAVRVVLQEWWFFTRILSSLRSDSCCDNAGQMTENLQLILLRFGV